MAKIKFTAKKLEALKSGTVRAEYFDIDLPGLCLRITPDGTKSFSVFYRHAGRVRRYTLGTYPTVTLKDAREGALDVLRDVLRGNDPQQQKTARREAGTFKELADLYMEKHSTPNKKSWRDDRRMFDKYLFPTLKHMKAADVTQ